MDATGKKMLCPKCGHDNLESAISCSECGLELIRTRQVPEDGLPSGETSARMAEDAPAVSRNDAHEYPQDDPPALQGSRAPHASTPPPSVSLPDPIPAPEAPALDPHIDPPSEVLADDFPPGSQFAGRYTIVSEGVTGGMGVTFKATDSESGAYVALKLIHPRLVANPISAERFQSESNVARRLSHPNIAALYGYGSYGKIMYYSTEWVEGETLATRLAQARLTHRTYSLREALDIVLPVMSALQYAHRFTIHRDVRPGNIIIGAGGEVKVTDFCVSNILSEPQRRAISLKMRTSQYMAPELSRDAAGVGVSADVYSLGVVLCEMLTCLSQGGEAGPRPSAVNPELPEELDDIISRAMSPVPDERLPDMNRMALEIGSLILPEGIDDDVPEPEYGPPGADETREVLRLPDNLEDAALMGDESWEKPRRTRGRGRLWLAAALAVAAVAGAAAYGTWQRAPAGPAVADGVPQAGETAGPPAQAAPLDSRIFDTSEEIAVTSSAGEADGAASGQAGTAVGKGRAVTLKAAVITVNQGGGGDYKTIGEAVAAAREGSRIIVEHGSYHESVRLTTPGVTIEGNPSAHIISQDADALYFNADNGKVKHLSFRYVGNGDHYGINIEGGALEVEACEVSWNTRSGIAINGGEGTTIIRSKIHDNTWSGIGVYNKSTGVLVEDNDIYNNGYPVEVKFGSQATIVKNRLHGSKMAGLKVSLGGRMIVEDNFIFGNAGPGIEIHPSTTAEVRANTVHDNLRGISVRRGANVTVVDNDFRNNIEGAFDVSEGSNVKLSGNKE